MSEAAPVLDNRGREIGEYTTGLREDDQRSQEVIDQNFDKYDAAMVLEDALQNMRRELVERWRAQGEPIPDPDTGATVEQQKHSREVQLAALDAGIKQYQGDLFAARNALYGARNSIETREGWARDHYYDETDGYHNQGAYQEAALQDAQGKVDAEGKPYDIKFGSQVEQDA